MDFDFYNCEAERFNFIKVSEILVDGEEFKSLLAEAIILYSMLQKLTGMSYKNNWVNKENRVFIYFTVEEIMKRRNISKPTAIKTLDELDIKKGIGVIERVRFGLRKPNIIVELQIKMAGQLDNYVERLSAYMKSTGKSYKNHKETIKIRKTRKQQIFLHSMNMIKAYIYNS